MTEGKVKWFNQKKGFGFISNAAGNDIFVHYSDITDEKSGPLREGELVVYELVQGEKGPKAAKVLRKTAVTSA